MRASECSHKLNDFIRTFDRPLDSDLALHFGEWMSLDGVNSVEITKQGIEVTVMRCYC